MSSMIAMLLHFTFINCTILIIAYFILIICELEYNTVMFKYKYMHINFMLTELKDKKSQTLIN